MFKLVTRCRKDSDQPGFPPTQPNQDYCQVYYPDRPQAWRLRRERRRTPRRLDQEGAGVYALRVDHAVSRSNISIERITWCELRTLKGHSAGGLSVPFSSDGKTLASGSFDHTIKVVGKVPNLGLEPWSKM